MFGPPGRAYVYTIHARQCFNVVTEARGVGSAVLIRAVEPLQGLLSMQKRRKTDVLLNLCRGPARLCEAFEIGRNMDGWDLTCGRRLWLTGPVESGERSGFRIGESVRIGVTSNVSARLRFFVRGTPFVSGPSLLNK